MRTDPTLFYQPLCPKLLADGGPLVLALKEYFPVGFGLLPRDEFPERGDVEDHTVVEIRIEA